MRTNEKSIKVALVGIGNCAQALIHGLEFYRQNPNEWRGLMNIELGGYKVTDIVPVAAFDVDRRKVGRDLSEAVFAAPNMAYRYPGVAVPELNVTVQMGPVMDGVSDHLAQFVEVSGEEPCDVVRILKDTGAEMLLNFLPTASAQAARFYADAAIKEAKIGYINGMPELIVCDPAYQEAARKSGVPLIGDDVKSQLGGTALHRALAMLFQYRGVHMAKTYQLNYAGNTDFYNLCHRGQSKHKTKQEAVTSLMPYPLEMSTGFSWVELMKDRKTAIFWIDGGNFGNAPLHFEAKLEVEDSANFAGVMVDMIRYMRLALDRGISGVLDSACAFLTKHPPVQIPDAICVDYVREFAEGKRER